MPTREARPFHSLYVIHWQSDYGRFLMMIFLPTIRYAIAKHVGWNRKLRVPTREARPFQSFRRTWTWWGVDVMMEKYKMTILLLSIRYWNSQAIRWKLRIQGCRLGRHGLFNLSCTLFTICSGRYKWKFYSWTWSITIAECIGWNWEFKSVN